MGPMLLLVVGIISCVGFSIYHLGESQRFELIGDSKNGGVFILGKKNASINYCSDQICKLIGNGSLPSQANGNPAVLAAMQNSIMGAPAVVTAKNVNGATVTPSGMKDNIASSSGAAPPATQAVEVSVTTAAAEKDEEEDEQSEVSEFDFN